MRTTVRLQDELLKRAKQRAAAEGRSLTSLIEEGLQMVLGRPGPRRARKVSLPVSRARGGTQPGVSLNQIGTLDDLMDGR